MSYLAVEQHRQWFSQVPLEIQGNCTALSCLLQWSDCCQHAPSRPHNGRFAATQTSVFFLGLKNTEHPRRASASWHRASLSLFRLRRAVSASRHHAPVTALYYSPGLTKHTRETEKEKKKGEQRWATGPFIFTAQSYRLKARHLLPSPSPGQEEKQNSHCNLTTNSWASTSFHPHKCINPPFIYLCLFPPLFFWMHPHFLCSECACAYSCTFSASLKSRNKWDKWVC